MLSVCGALLLTSVAASAQEVTPPAIALNRFQPAPAGDRMFSVQSPFVAGDPGVHVMLLADYAHNPLVVVRTSNNENVGAAVSSQLFLHIDANLALFNRIALNVDFPVAVLQGGDNPQFNAGTTLASPSSAQLGDLRAGLRVRLLGDYFDAFQLALGGYVWVPTGAKDQGSFVGDGTVRALPQVIVGGRTDRIVWSAAVGPEIKESADYLGTKQGLSIWGGAGVGFLLGEDRHFQVGPEVNFSTVLEDPNARNTNAEVLLNARYRFASFMEAGIGAGPGLTSGVGTPDFRAVAMIAFTPEQKKPQKAPPPSDRDKDTILDQDDACPDEPGVPNKDPKKHGCPPPKDRDKDGIIDDLDACPDVPGLPNDDPKKNGCPPPKDTDKDGIIDDLDACVDIPGVPSDDAKKNGCPPDKDGDGVFDKDDACVDIPGIKTADPKTNGCPGDTDKDTIRDDVDACPLEKGKPDKDPKKNGCPQSVRVTETEVIILQQVQFDTAKATIKKVSDALLDEVAGVLKEHPEILKLEVQGHTDDRGKAKDNDKLSQDRANAVMAAMVKRGIDAGRMTAKGYGQNVPIADNKTADGRTKNRRVQFKIMEKAPKKAEP